MQNHKKVAILLVKLWLQIIIQFIFDFQNLKARILIISVIICVSYLDLKIDGI